MRRLGIGPEVRLYGVGERNSVVVIAIGTAAGAVLGAPATPRMGNSIVG